MTWLTFVFYNLVIVKCCINDVKCLNLVLDVPNVLLTFTNLLLSKTAETFIISIMILIFWTDKSWQTMQCVLLKA